MNIRTPDCPSLLFIGCGNMGAAIIGGALAQLPGARVLGLDPDLTRARSLLPAGARVELHSVPSGLEGLSPDLVILGVKPQVFSDLDPRVRAILAQPAVVSIMAGIPLPRLISEIGHPRVARVMPNLPAMVGAGMSLGCADRAALDTSTLRLIETLSGAVGRFDWADDEAEFELANPVFSCGPGFVFAFAEQMVRAAEASGLPADLADRLVRQTLLGAARMLTDDTRSATELKRAVTSPGGTTQAGLTALEAPDGLPGIIPETFARARARALELAQG